MTEPSIVVERDEVTAAAVITGARAAWIAAGRASADAQTHHGQLWGAAERGETVDDVELGRAADVRIKTAEAEAAAGRHYLGLVGLRPTVTVTVDNAYACGRTSQITTTVTAPLTTEIPEDWWCEQVPSGDGHPCGAREHALYTYEITASTDRPELIGVGYQWG